MNQEKLDNIYQNELIPKQKKILPLFLAGQTDEQIAWEIGAIHRSTTSHQLRSISKKFGFPPENEPDYRCNLVELFAKFKPELVGFKALEKCGVLIHIKIWNLETGELKNILTGHTYPVSSLAISPNEQTLVSGSYDGKIKIWQLP